MLKLTKVTKYRYEVYTESDLLMGEFLEEIDGFFVFYPSNDLKGFYSEGYLTALAAELKKLNAPWNA